MIHPTIEIRGLSHDRIVIDSGYRGEIIVKFNYLYWLDQKDLYKVGDRVAQLIIMPYPKIELVEVENLSDSDRLEGGFGSSGN